MSESTSERGPRGIAIIFALRKEIKPLLKESHIETQVIKKPAVLSKATFRGIPITFCQTGVGMANAHEAAEFLLGQTKPNLIVSVGCAGATHADLKPGDIILPSEIRSETPSDCFKTDERARTELERLAQEEQISYRTGPLVTVWKMAGRDTKESMGQKGMIALDMETAAVATIAEKAKVPLVSLRAIFDPMEENLPCSEPFDEEHPVRFLIKNPKMILKIPKYARWNRICQRSLARVLERFIDCYGR